MASSFLLGSYKTFYHLKATEPFIKWVKTGLKEMGFVLCGGIHLRGKAEFVWLYNRYFV